MSRLSALRNGTEEVYEVIQAFWETDSDWFVNYKYLQDETGMNKKELEPIVKILKTWGYLEYARGLMNDEGQLGGSGWKIPYELRDEVELAIDLHDAENKTFTQITINRVKYKLIPAEESK